MERKPLRCRQGQHGLGLRLDRRHLTAAVLQDGGHDLGVRQTVGMIEPLGEAQGILTPLDSWVREAQTP